MSYRRRNRIDQSPIGHTCPLIDDAQSKIDAALEFLDSITWEDTEEEQALADEAARIREGLRIASVDLLERIRTANETLRNWGNEQYYEAEESKERVDELEKEADDR